MTTIKNLTAALSATALVVGIGLAQAQAPEPAQPDTRAAQPAAHPTPSPSASRFNWEKPLMTEPPAAGGTLPPKADRN